MGTGLESSTVRAEARGLHHRQAVAPVTGVPYAAGRPRRDALRDHRPQTGNPLGLIVGKRVAPNMIKKGGGKIKRLLPEDRAWLQTADAWCNGAEVVDPLSLVEFTAEELDLLVAVGYIPPAD